MKKKELNSIIKAANITLIQPKIDWVAFHKAHKKVGIKQMASCKKCKWIIPWLFK